MTLDKRDLERIKDIIKNDIILTDNTLDYEWKLEEGEIDLIQIITSLYNLLYEVCTGEKYDYFFHWLNKVGVNVDDDYERYFDKFLKEGDKQ